jgi:hypothetical protein
MTMSPEFLELRSQLMELIREESLKAMGAELGDAALEGLGITVDDRTLANVLWTKIVAADGAAP